MNNIWNFALYLVLKLLSFIFFLCFGLLRKQYFQGTSVTCLQSVRKFNTILWFHLPSVLYNAGPLLARQYYLLLVSALVHDFATRHDLAFGISLQYAYYPEKNAYKIFKYYQHVHLEVP